MRWVIQQRTYIETWDSKTISNAVNGGGSIVLGDIVINCRNNLQSNH